MGPRRQGTGAARALGGPRAAAKEGATAQYTVRSIAATGHLGLRIRELPSHSAATLAGVGEGAIGQAEETPVEAEGRAWRRIHVPAHDWTADEHIAPA